MRLLTFLSIILLVHFWCDAHARPVQCKDAQPLCGNEDNKESMALKTTAGNVRSSIRGRLENMRAGVLDRRPQLGEWDLDQHEFKGCSLRPDLTGIASTGIKLAGSRLVEAQFRHSLLADPDLSCTDLRAANFEQAVILGGTLHDAVLEGAKFKDAAILDSDLTNADFSQAHLEELRFEPSHLPDIDGIAQAYGLARLQAVRKEALINLRTEFRKAGYENQARNITFALNHIGSPDSVSSFLQWLAFEWTCRWSIAPLRPLFLALVLSILYVPVYFLFILDFEAQSRRPKSLQGCHLTYQLSRLMKWLKKHQDDGVYLNLPETPSQDEKNELLQINSLTKAIFYSMLFALLNAFLLGQIGTLLLLLSSRRQRFGSAGVARIIAGSQTLACGYLVALSFTTILVDPFVTAPFLPEP